MDGACDAGAEPVGTDDVAGVDPDAAASVMLERVKVASVIPKAPASSGVCAKFGDEEPWIAKA